jgi:hypothetical protein
MTWLRRRHIERAAQVFARGPQGIAKAALKATRALPQRVEPALHARRHCIGKIVD